MACSNDSAPQPNPSPATGGRHAQLAAVLMLCLALPGCYALRASQGGGQTAFERPREFVATDIALAAGYRVELVASGLTYPTSIAFDGDGRAHVVEAGYSYGEDWTTPRLLRIERDGELTEIARGERNGPWTGAVFHEGGAFYVAEGGTLEGGRILRVAADGSTRVIVADLPSRGDHHTNGPAIGPDGAIYFAIGVATNSGVVGEDNAKFGWLHRVPDFADVPCEDIELAGTNFESEDPLGDRDAVTTGAYVPFGTGTTRGQIIQGQLPCTGAILKIQPDGSGLEVVAWGLRNPFGLAFSPAGELYVTENSYNVRGSRPVFGAGDLLRVIRAGTWYGWPDYHGDRRIDSARFRAPGEPIPELLFARYPNEPPAAVAVFPVHASANGLDFSRSNAFGFVGEAFVAEFGDMAPDTGKVLAPVGFKVVRVDPHTGVIEDFAVNRGERNGPASAIGGGGLERPVAVRFDPPGTALYVVDFGVMTMGEHGPVPRPETGAVWRIRRGER
jgi:glucose/arabinose dehydrogenase